MSNFYTVIDYIFNLMGTLWVFITDRWYLSLGYALIIVAIITKLVIVGAKPIDGSSSRL